MNAKAVTQLNFRKCLQTFLQRKSVGVELYPKEIVVTGNVPVVMRESLLPKVFDMGEKAVERSLEIFGGMMGPFCLETIVTDKLEFYAFEISSRIVAGTNVSISGSPYSEFVEPGMSRRPDPCFRCVFEPACCSLFCFR